MILVGGAVLAAPRFVAAQTSIPAPGARVRISAPRLQIVDVTGNVVHATADSLTIQPESQSPLTIPIADLSQLEVSRGSDRGLGFQHGGKYGALFGGLAGLGYWLSWGCDEYCLPSLAILGAGGTIVGFLMGGLLGVMAPPERWEDVSLVARPTGMWTPGGRSMMTLGMRIAF
jgi:hypothetical protein